MRLPMGIVDMWTILHAVIFVVQIVLTVVVLRKVNESEEKANENYAYKANAA